MRTLKQGFTLFELLVMAIVGIFIGLVGVNLMKGVNKRKVVSDVNALTYYLDQARANSVKTSTDQTVTIASDSSNLVTLTYGTKTATMLSTVLCAKTSLTDATCTTSFSVTYKAPQGEMCWTTLGTCNYTDTTLKFTRAPYSATLVMQGVFGYASIRDIK